MLANISGGLFFYISGFLLKFNNQYRKSISQKNKGFDKSLKPFAVLVIPTGLVNSQFY